MASALDIESSTELMCYLRVQQRVAPDEEPKITVLAGGVSNRTVLVSRQSGESWVVKQALAKLRVKTDWFSSPERIHREASGMRCLYELAPKGAITRLIFEDHEQHLLAMEAVPEPHENWKSMLLRGELRSEHVAEFGRLLGLIHRKARERREELETPFADASFFESLRLEPYYAYTGRQVGEATKFMQDLIDETRANRGTLVHGDYSPKNVLVRENRLVLLDHEVIHWGDPAFDIGFAMTHFLSKAHHLSAHRAAFASSALHFWESYGDASFEARAVRNTLGCMLARVAGRSPLEYLDSVERTRQQSAVLKLIAQPPQRISQLVEGFVSCL